ncbi:hypothetical protein V2J09_002115 [Rumex salicifolius]
MAPLRLCLPSLEWGCARVPHLAIFSASEIRLFSGIFSHGIPQNRKLAIHKHDGKVGSFIYNGPFGLREITCMVSRVHNLHNEVMNSIDYSLQPFSTVFIFEEKRMEACKPIHESFTCRTLTPLRLIRGILCLIVLISTAFMMLVFGGFMSAVTLRLFSIHYSRKMTSMFLGAWLALWPFLFEKINGIRVVFSGETLPRENRVLLIANHRTEVDWMYLWDLALRKGNLGYFKYVLKSSLMKLPVFGWAFQILEFIPVKRKWELDETTLHQMLSTFKDPRDALWLAVFPEGTDFTEQKCIRNQKYAAENGLPILKNVLLPKTKGFFSCISELRSTTDAVYDITIGYKPRCPSFMDNVFGLCPSEVHFHTRRVPIRDIPKSEERVTTWLLDTFQLKDDLLNKFGSSGHFPGEVTTEGELSLVKCLVNFTSVLIFTSLCAYLTFLYTSIKMYVLLVCIYLATATSFNIRPSPIHHSSCPSDISATNISLNSQILNTFHKHTHFPLYLPNCQFNSTFFFNGKLSILHKRANLNLQQFDHHPDMIQILDHHISSNLHCTHHLLLTL